VGQQRPAPSGKTLKVYFIGIGEKLEDLQAFNAEEFAQALIS
jgi:fused signal recognition particle receptor